MSREIKAYIVGTVPTDACKVLDWVVSKSGVCAQRRACMQIDDTIILQT